MARKIEIQLVGDASNLERTFGRVARSADSFGSKVGGAFLGVAKGAAIVAGAGALGAVALTLKTGTEEWAEHAKVAAQTAAVLDSTGGVANVSAKHVDELAGALMRKTGIDDEAIQTGENLLLTFKNVRNEVGEGNKVFDRATTAALDLSTAGFGSIESASKMLGKALNDPIKGMSAMSRAGVTFSKGQQETIKSLVKTGDLLAAQKIILKEVESQVGGSAVAYGQTLPGQINKLKQTFSNLSGELVGSLVPGFTKGLTAVAGFVDRLSAAEGWRARLNIVWEGAQEAGATLAGKIKEVVAGIDWGGVWGDAKGIGEGLAKTVKEQLGKVKWDAVGKRVADGVAAGIGEGGRIAKELAQVVSDGASRINWERVGKIVGPGLATAIVTAFTTLMDPGFWARNWDLALSVGLVAAGGPIGRAVIRLGAMVGRALGGVIDDAVLGIASKLGRLGPLFVAAFLIAERVALAAVRRLGNLISGAASAIASRLGRLLTFVVKVLGIEAAINAIANFATAVYGKLKELFEYLKSLPSLAYSYALQIGGQIVQGILNGIGDLVGRIGSKIAGGIRGGIDWARNNVGSTAEEYIARVIGKPMGEGVLAGWIFGTAALPAKMAETLRNAIERMKGVVEGLRGKFSDAWGTLAGDALAAFDAKAEKMIAALRAKLDKAIAEIDAKLAKKLKGIDAFGAELTPAEKALKDLQDAADAQRITQALEDTTAAAKEAADELARLQSSSVTVKEGATPEEIAAAEDARAKAIEDAKDKLLAAQRAVAQAQYDEKVAALQKQAELERAERDKEAEAKRTAAEAEAEKERARVTARFAEREKELAAQLALDRRHLAARLALLEAEFAKEGAKRGELHKRLMKMLHAFGIDYKSSGRLLGEAFAEGMREAEAAVRAAASRLAEIAGSTLNVKVSASASGKVPKLASGGFISRTGLALVHRGETVIPASVGARGGGSSLPEGDLVLVLDGQEIGRVARRELLRTGARNVNVGLT